ncbi:hypothetical protein [Nostoc sp.]|nr:hypothetical protein [Nostoc sp. S13]
MPRTSLREAAPTTTLIIIAPCPMPHVPCPMPHAPCQYLSG